jgi:hypothetical protein
MPRPVSPRSSCARPNWIEGRGNAREGVAAGGCGLLELDVAGFLTGAGFGIILDVPNLKGSNA